MPQHGIDTPGHSAATQATSRYATPWHNHATQSYGTAMPCQDMPQHDMLRHCTVRQAMAEHAALRHNHVIPDTCCTVVVVSFPCCGLQADNLQANHLQGNSIQANRLQVDSKPTAADLTTSKLTIISELTTSNPTRTAEPPPSRALKS